MSLILKNSIIKILIFSCFLGLNLNAFTLQEGVDEVLRTNPIVKERFYNYKGTLQDLRITKSEYLPTLDYTGTFAKEKTKSPSTGFQSRSLYTYEHSLQLTQNLFNGFGTLHAEDSRKAQVLAAANQYIENANDVAYRFVSQYLAVLKARDTLVITKENVTFHEMVLEKVKKLFDSGSTMRSELEKIDTSMSLAQSNYIVAQNNLSDALFTLERILGRYVKAEELERTTFTGILPENETVMIEYAKKYNPSILVANYNIKAVKSEHKASYKNFYPKVDAFVRKKWSNDINGTEGDDESSDVGVNISYNIFRGGADDALIKKSLTQVSQEKETKRDVIRKLKEQGRLAWSTKTNVTAQLKYLEKYVKTSDRTLNLYQLEYDLGRRKLLDLLVAQNDFVSARTQVITAKNDLLLANYRIFDAMGIMVQNILGSKALDYIHIVDLDVVGEREIIGNEKLK